MPLRLSIGAGIALTAAGFAYLVYAMYQAYITHDVVHGWTSVVVLQCVFSGGILVVLGLIGDYIARIYEESKGRPLYVVSETCNVAVPPRIERAVVLDPREDSTESRSRQAEAGSWQGRR
jgi:dolichol-phosphate mannosyltransferase